MTSMKSTGRDRSKKVPRLSPDPGCYDRGSVVNDGDDSRPSPTDEWAGNKAGWQGMPRPLGGPEDHGEPSDEQDRL